MNKAKKPTFLQECKEELSVLFCFIAGLALFFLLVSVHYAPTAHLMDGIKGAGL